MAEQEILRLGELTPERKPVELIRNGETVVLQGFVDSKRCPATVRAEISSARREWAENPTQANWYTFVRSHILAVVPGMEFGEADIVAGDDDESSAMLDRLGWLRKSDDESPLSEARTSTTDPSSPTSSSPTTSDPTSS